MSNKFKINRLLKLKNRQGSALVFILIAFLIISILSTSIINLFSNNLKQAKYQQDSLQAYYLAYSGAELAFAALLDNSEVNLKKLVNKTVSELKEENISFGKGKITVVSKLTNEENFDGWIEITSTGTLDKNNLSYKRTMLFDPKNPVDIYWKN